jgi:hypothetical protein
MAASPIKMPVSRRTTLAGLGAGGLGVALAATVGGAAAQGSATDPASHPVVGTWFLGGDPTNPDDVSFGAFNGDGTYASVHAIAGAGIGAWRATGERTGELVVKQVNNTFDAGQYRGGINSLWLAFEVAADGRSFTGPIRVALTNPDGTYFAGFDATMNATRLEAGPAPSVESLQAGTPTP